MGDSARRTECFVVEPRRGYGRQAAMNAFVRSMIAEGKTVRVFRQDGSVVDRTPEGETLVKPPRELFGIPVVLDPSLPPDTIRLVDDREFSGWVQIQPFDKKARQNAAWNRLEVAAKQNASSD